MLSEIRIIIFILSENFATVKASAVMIYMVIAWPYIGIKGKWIMKNYVLITSEINMLHLYIPEQRLSFDMSNHRYFVLPCFFPSSEFTTDLLLYYSICGSDHSILKAYMQ